MSRDEAALFDVVHAAQQVADFVAGLDRQTFEADARTQSAVLHQLLVIGEAVKRLSPGFKKFHPGMPWRLIAGMRDKLIHEYDEVDLDEVWSTVTRDAPALLGYIESLVLEEER